MEIPAKAVPIIGNNKQKRSRAFWVPINHVLVGDSEIGPLGRRYASLIILAATVAVGCATFTTTSWYFWTKSVSLMPSFFSGILAILMISSLYVRNVLHFSMTVYSILSLTLNATITAVLLQGLFGATATYLTNWQMPYLVSGAVLMSWVGMRPLVPIVWSLTIMVGIINLQSVSVAMGGWGYLLVLGTVIGVLLQIDRGMLGFRKEIAYDFFGYGQATGGVPIIPEKSTHNVRDVPALDGRSE